MNPKVHFHKWNEPAKIIVLSMPEEAMQRLWEITQQQVLEKLEADRVRGKANSLSTLDDGMKESDLETHIIDGKTTVMTTDGDFLCVDRQCEHYGTTHCHQEAMVIRIDIDESYSDEYPSKKFECESTDCLYYYQDHTHTYNIDPDKADTPIPKQVFQQWEEYELVCSNTECGWHFTKHIHIPTYPIFEDNGLGYSIYQERTKN